MGEEPELLVGDPPTQCPMVEPRPEDASVLAGAQDGEPVVLARLEQSSETEYELGHPRGDVRIEDCVEQGEAAGDLELSVMTRSSSAWDDGWAAAN